MEEEDVAAIAMEVDPNNSQKPSKSNEAEAQAAPPGITVSLFDYSVENHCRAIDMISELCEEPELEIQQTDIQRLSSSITFIREWKHFCYKPRILKFACKSENPRWKDVVGGTELPQFSSAAVPKIEGTNGKNIVPEISKDFIMYVGGSVWALDWCPRAHQSTKCDVRSEFVAVAAHPPDSSYHKIGAPLTGRGLIQIWCVLNVGRQEEIVPAHGKKKPRGRPRKMPIEESVDKLDAKCEKVNDELSKPKKARGRPRKNSENITTDNLDGEAREPSGKSRKKPIMETGTNIDGHNQYVEALEVAKKDINCNVTVEGPEELHKSPRGSTEIFVKCKRLKQREKRNRSLIDESVLIPAVKLPEYTAVILSENLVSNESQEVMDLVPLDSEPPRKKIPDQENLLTKNDEMSIVNPETSFNCGHDNIGSGENIANTGSIGFDPAIPSIPVDVTLPRVVLCLAHNGKVAWDVKWRPHDSYPKSKHSMGYLAALLGNGALEVWDVPLPRATKITHAACQKEGTDPRFVKLNPVFKCSSLKYGDRQSIPLTLEWSTSSPHDLILAGCHDGVVALWKFMCSDPCKDTRPLLRFIADTVPIRTLAWAPVGSDAESANIVVTAGHKGIKFWDLRDPFHPLWDLNPVQRVIYSLDWVPDPRCLMISFDDGTLRILSLLKAANDAPVTGQPFVGTTQQGLHSYYCSQYAIWSIQVSRRTGMVAYCGADGTALRFQLTSKVVEKDPFRNRAPHFLCGSLTEEESVLTIVSPLRDVPFPMKKSLNEWSNAPRTIRGFLAVANSEKRAKEKASKNKKSETLALCYHDEPRSEDEALKTSKSKQKSKAKTNSKQKDMEYDQALICRDSDQEDIRKEEEDSIKEEIHSENEIEKLPSKLVAMHKVRWNLNEGSERWLCYGGASGVVRCQEINLSSA